MVAKASAACGVLALAASVTAAQAPAPPARPAPTPAAPAAGSSLPAIPTLPVETPPAEAALGVPIYPTAQFLRSYDAGRGQRFYLYGSPASFAEIVAYYRTILKQRGELVFEQPATHTFPIGRFRQETMAFQPGVTVKDFTTRGSGGFPNPRRGTQPERFPTIIQVVPVVPQPSR